MIKKLNPNPNPNLNLIIIGQGLGPGLRLGKCMELSNVKLTTDNEQLSLMQKIISIFLKLLSEIFCALNSFAFAFQFESRIFFEENILRNRPILFYHDLPLPGS
ncbi:MAG TPA: hypothetical protein VI757_08905 [Bacteroidia bacterium]|nr:hypothetical protein [Bacteroidia bacterium]